MHARGIAARPYLVACYPVAYAAKPPMCENKILAAFQKTMCDRAARQRCMVALRAKRQYVVVPYAF